MKIYIGNLSYEVTEDDLRAALGQFGQVESVSIINDKFSGRSKGFGFAEMASQTEAEAAIEGLNGKELKGRAMKVNEARAQSQSRGGGRGGPSGGRGGYNRGGDGRGGGPRRGR
jgi:cold-inducible RNA-binding protein